MTVPETLFNFRDLGGHSAAGGRVRTGLLFRSNAVVGLSPEHIGALGLRTAVDLREPGEQQAEPCTIGPDGVVHLHPLLDFGGRRDAFPALLDQATHWIAETRGAALAAAIGLLANAELPAVFFCSAGKDRTGMLSAVLLSALEVERAAVVADYALSGPRLPQSYVDLARVRALHAGIATPLSPDQFGSPPELMTSVLDGIEARHGSVAQYLLDHGLDKEDLALLRERLVEVA